MILDIDTEILFAKEPYNAFPASSIPPLNLIFSFFGFVPLVVVITLVSCFKSSNLKKSEKVAVLKSLLSFSTTTLSIAKFVFVN